MILASVSWMPVWIWILMEATFLIESQTRLRHGIRNGVYLQQYQLAGRLLKLSKHCAAIALSPQFGIYRKVFNITIRVKFPIGDETEERLAFGESQQFVLLALESISLLRGGALLKYRETYDVQVMERLVQWMVA